MNSKKLSGEVYVPDGKDALYIKPKLTKLGNMARVTKKSGTPPDQQQVTKPGGGGG